MARDRSRSRSRHLEPRQADRVSLNVGGLKYVASRTTLCSVPDSMLGRMFGGAIPSDKDDEGSVWIDRDGAIFRWVLNHLRGNRALPATEAELELLVGEANYFSLPELEQAASGRLVQARAANEAHVAFHRQGLVVLQTMGEAMDKFGDTIKRSTGYRPGSYVWVKATCEQD